MNQLLLESNCVLVQQKSGMSVPPHTFKADSMADLLSNAACHSPAAEYCKSYTFPNGQTGYLGAAGEWKVVLGNQAEIDIALNACGRAIEKGAYWTST